MKTPHVLPQLFVDQDGVLADLDAHYFRHFGKRADHPGAFSPEEFWGAVNSIPDFWLTIPPFDGLLPFWGTLVREHGHPIVLTSIAKHASERVEADKRQWIANHLGPDVMLIACRGKDRRLYCRSGDFLIDDWDHHRASWERSNGVFVHHRGDYTATLAEFDGYLQHAKTRADLRTLFLAYDGSMMCEHHPGREWPHDHCPGPGMPWTLSGKTAILAALKRGTEP